MAIKYGFFNSVNGDRKYNADDIRSTFPPAGVSFAASTFIILHMNH